MKVLILEDEYETAELLRSYLSRCGDYDVTICYDGETALDAYRKAHHPLLLVDIGLSGMDGFEFCRKIREFPRGKYSVILVITGMVVPENLNNVLDAGADDYIRKPVDIELFKVRFRINERIALDRVESEKQVIALNQCLDELETTIEAKAKKCSEIKKLSKSLFEGNADPIAIYDLDDRVIDVNPAFIETFGYEREELIGKKFPGHFGVDKGKFIQWLNQCNVGRGVSGYETIRKRKDGTPLHVSITVSPITDGQNNLKAVSFWYQDITDRKLAEAKLKDREKELSAITQIAPFILFVVNEERRVLMINHAGLKFAGRSAEEMIGQRGGEALRCLHALDDPRGCGFGVHCKDCTIRQTVVNTFETGENHTAVEAEFITTRQGKSAQLNLLISTARYVISGSPRVLVSLQDITERKQAREALQKSERQKSLILNSTWEMFAYYDTELRVKWANKAAGDSVGEKAEDLVGRHCYEIWQQRNAPCPECPCLKALETKEFQEAEAKTADGRYWHIRGYPVLNDDGDVEGMIEFGQDITERKKAEAERSKYLQELQFINDTIIKVSRMEDIDVICQFIAEGIHEINQDAYIGVTLYDRERNVIAIKAVAGIGELPQLLLERFGLDLRKMSFNPDELGEGADIYTTGKLEKVPGGLYQLLAGKVPRAVCKSAEKLTGLENVYSVGFALKDKPYGGIIIFLPKDKNVQCSTAIESLARHISVILHQRQAEQALRKSERRHRTVAENFPNGAIFLFDKDIRYKLVAGKILDSVGLNPEDCVGKTLYEVFPKTITDIAGDPDKQIFDDETVYYEVEYKNRIFANWGVPIKDETDKIIEGLVYAVDITDLKEKERELTHTLKEKTALLMEVQHRTRNNMQVINSMLALKSQHVTDEEVLQVFEDMRNRIFSMALVHRLLHRSKSLSRIDLKDYITELVIALRDSYWEAAIKTSFELDLESVSVLIDCALPCGLILNELITNSFKYAFPGDRKGVIRITLRQDETEVIHLTVLDNGVGIPESVDLKDTESLGLQLISILTDQLGAKLEFDPVDGVSCGLHFKDDLYFERV